MPQNLHFNHVLFIIQILPNFFLVIHHFVDIIDAIKKSAYSATYFAQVFVPFFMWKDVVLSKHSFKLSISGICVAFELKIELLCPCFWIEQRGILLALNLLYFKKLTGCDWEIASKL